jgi:import inner membrane translocase subunit TIM23
VISGLSAGGVWGLAEGVGARSGDTFKLRLNSVLNSCTRRGPLIGNSTAVAGAFPISIVCADMSAMFYTTFSHAACSLRGGSDDVVNDIVAGGLAGALFKSTGAFISAISQKV